MCVQAHPHNHDRNFDFWAAVGTFDGAAQPNAGTCSCAPHVNITNIMC